MATNSIKKAYKKKIRRSNAEGRQILDYWWRRSCEALWFLVGAEQLLLLQAGVVCTEPHGPPSVTPVTLAPLRASGLHDGAPGTTPTLPFVLDALPSRVVRDIFAWASSERVSGRHQLLLTVLFRNRKNSSPFLSIQAALCFLGFPKYRNTRESFFTGGRTAA